MSGSTLWYKTIALIAILLVATGLGACAPKTDKENDPTPVLSGQPKTTYPMPPSSGNNSLGEMGWTRSDGQRVIVSSYQDKVLVLDFYATWCMPCRESIPHLVDLQKRFGPQGLAIVGLNVGGPNDLSQVPSFARDFSINYPLAVPDQGLSEFLMSDSDAIPQTFIFDRRGQLIKRFIGYGGSTARELEATLRAALGPDLNTSN